MREIATFVPLIILAFWIGIYPSYFPEVPGPAGQLDCREGTGRLFQERQRTGCRSRSSGGRRKITGPPSRGGDSHLGSIQIEVLRRDRGGMP